VIQVTRLEQGSDCNPQVSPTAESRRIPFAAATEVRNPAAKTLGTSHPLGSGHARSCIPVVALVDTLCRVMVAEIAGEALQEVATIPSRIANLLLCLKIRVSLPDLLLKNHGYVEAERLTEAPAVEVECGPAASQCGGKGTQNRDGCSRYFQLGQN
jgi:hypothetical protein